MISAAVPSVMADIKRLVSRRRLCGLEFRDNVGVMVARAPIAVLSVGDTRQEYQDEADEIPDFLHNANINNPVLIVKHCG